MFPVRRAFASAVALTTAFAAAGCGAPEPATSTGQLAAVGAPVTAVAQPTRAAEATPRPKATHALAPTPTVAPAIPATATPPPALAIAFAVDQADITRGACTTLRWTVTGGVIVALDGADVPDSGTREVCPAESATYALVVTPFSGRDEQRAVSVVVHPPEHAAAAAGNDEPEDDEPAAPPPPPPPTATPCDINCEVTPEPLEPLPELPTAAPAAPQPTDEPAPPAEPTDEPAPPPEPTAPPAPAPAPAP